VILLSALDIFLNIFLIFPNPIPSLSSRYHGQVSRKVPSMVMSASPKHDSIDLDLASFSVDIHANSVLMHLLPRSEPGRGVPKIAAKTKSQPEIPSTSRSSSSHQILPKKKKVSTSHSGSRTQNLFLATIPTSTQSFGGLLLRYLHCRA
jgi:hypothetical protein